jgi:hypothetical protein
LIDGLRRARPKAGGGGGALSPLIWRVLATTHEASHAGMASLPCRDQCAGLIRHAANSNIVLYGPVTTMVWVCNLVPQKRVQPGESNAHAIVDRRRRAAPAPAVGLSREPQRPAMASSQNESRGSQGESKPRAASSACVACALRCRARPEQARACQRWCWHKTCSRTRVALVAQRCCATA